MNGSFRVVTTPSFEREFRKLSQRNAKLLEALEAMIAILAEDPHGRSGLHPIKNSKA
jgi:mRNA-degrading endonuclease RelE of RelBE toxin-antitoxin system